VPGTAKRHAIPIKWPHPKLVVEWNAYRYVPLKGGKPGVVLHGISRRAYGEGDAKKFLTSLKDWCSNAKNALNGFNASAISPQP